MNMRFIYSKSYLAGSFTSIVIMSLVGFLCISCVKTKNLSNGQRITFDQRGVEVAISRGTEPTVVFETGNGTDMQSWNSVIAQLPEGVQTFAYNRPSHGNSDSTATRRDGKTIVAELRRILRQGGLAPPYILVGHSLGGLYAQLFAREYPDEVVGLVLVDPSSPFAFVGEGTLENQTLLVRALEWLRTSFNRPNIQEEYRLAKETAEVILSLPTYSGGPVEILSATEIEAVPGASIKEQERIRRFFLMRAAEIPTLYPCSHQKWISGGHMIPEFASAEVAFAIQRTRARHLSLSISNSFKTFKCHEKL